MATTHLLTRHVDQGKTVKESLTESKDYALNPEKTKHQDTELVTGFECDPKTADVEFHYAKKIYEQKTGRKQKNDVILYQFRQSFKPGEIMPEEANKIGYEWAMRFLKGKHAFYVSTHTDKAHIHNHIYWNSVTLDCTRKFRNFLGSGKAGRRLSDLICLEHNLSVIENPSRKKSKSKWADSRKKTQRELLEEMIDAALNEKPKDWNELMELLIRNGCQVKPGKVYSLRAPGFTRFARLDTLSPGYQPKDLLGVLSGKRKHVTRQSRREKTLVQEQRISLVINIQRIIREKKGAGYERWAKTYNLKQMAKALNYLTTHHFSDYEKLKNSAKSLMEKRDRLAGELNHLDQEIERNEKWKNAIVAYAQTRGVFTEYKKARYSRSFYLEYQEEIERYREAAETFRELSGGEKPPKIDQLKEEGQKLYQQRKKLRADYDQVKDEAREVLAVKENIDCLLGYSGLEKDQEKSTTRKEDIKSKR